MAGREFGWTECGRWVVMVALLVVGLGARAAIAQDIAGTWQGTMQVFGGVRMVVKISKVDEAEKSAWKAVLYRIDQDGYGRAASSVSVQDGTLRLAIASVDFAYEGKVAADGAAIAGSAQQAGQAYALNFARATSETEWKMEAPKKMAKDAEPSFEVATIKPTAPDWGSQGFHSGNGRRIWCDNETAANITQFVYGVHPKQLVGAPSWFFEQRWDVDGYPDVAGEPDYKQMQGMYRKLLEERFGLKFHREKRNMSAYVLTVAKSGSKLQKSVDQEAMSDTTYTQWNSQRRVLRVTSTTMPEFVMTLNFDMEKPVVDQTGLTGKWDFLLQWRPDTAPDTGDTNALPGLFTAIQEQVGLKLEGTSAPVEVLVVDRVERPGAN